NEGDASLRLVEDEADRGRLGDDAGGRRVLVPQARHEGDLLPRAGDGARAEHDVYRRGAGDPVRRRDPESVHGSERDRQGDAQEAVGRELEARVAPIRIGTCSWADQSLSKFFYPKGTPARERLSYYAERFDTVEVDSTFYRLPSPEMV